MCGVASMFGLRIRRSLTAGSVVKTSKHAALSTPVSRRSASASSSMIAPIANLDLQFAKWKELPVTKLVAILRSPTAMLYGTITPPERLD